MVIQGSACIYSKKVEYLHSLVYQALEFVTDRKVKALRSKGTAAEADDENEFDDEEHFLCLDDGLEGAFANNTIFAFIFICIESLERTVLNP